MVLFLAISAGLWMLGRYMGAPYNARWMMIALVYIAILIVQITAPSDNPLRVALGGSLSEWGAIGGLALAAWAYSKSLKRVKKRVRPENRPKAEKSETLQGVELDRYARHIVLREIGGVGQQRLRAAKVMVIGSGGLGSPALMYLAAAGVGTIGVIDDDVVEVTNLQRQIIHTDDRIGTPKVFSAQVAMNAQNPFITVRPYNRRLTEEIAAELFKDYDLILDGTDNFETRYLVNRVAAEHGRPLISAALTQWEGQISTFDPKKGAPCYQCIFPMAPAPELAPNCAEAGVLSPLPGVLGSLMAVEAAKELTGAGSGLRGRLMIYDALHGETRMIKVQRRDDCPICGSRKA